MPNKTILDYLKQNNISDTTKFSLQDDGEGVYIKDWGYSLDKPTLPTIEQVELSTLKNKKVRECRAYLESTDWQVIRLIDPSSSEPLKEGVAAKRTLARDTINDIQQGLIESAEDLNAIDFT